jgi:hypothetical protein
MNLSTTIRKPSAWIPLAMSFTALAIVLIHIAVFGAAREADEGTTAHLFQILMAAQAPVVAFFLIKWLPRNPKPVLLVLALQVCAGIAALSPVFLLNL